MSTVVRGPQGWHRGHRLSDSLVTFGETRLPHGYEANEDVQVGGSTGRRGGQRGALSGAAQGAGRLPPDELRLGSRDEVFDTFLKLHPKLKERFFLNTKEHDSDPYESSQFTIVIANPHGIFGVESYREVFEFERFWAIGSGRRFALGAMHAVYDGQDRARSGRGRRAGRLRIRHQFGRAPCGCTPSRLKEQDHGPHRIKVPDIGDFKDVAVIEVLVKPGDTVKAEQSLITVESDKASMEIPSSHAGVVQALKVAVGDKVNQGTVLLMLEAEAAAAAHPHRPQPAAPAGRCGRPQPAWPAGTRWPPATPAAPTCSATCWCWAPARAAIRPPSARPTWA
jgi:ATP-dependent HslUV protease subunit HslV